MTAAHDNSCAELRGLIDELSREQTEELRLHALRLLAGEGGQSRRHRLSFTGVGAGNNPHLGAEAKHIIRTTLRALEK